MMDSAVATHLLQLILERTARRHPWPGAAGLPLAVELARAGFKTTGIDIDAGRVASINGLVGHRRRPGERRRPAPAQWRTTGDDRLA